MESSSKNLRGEGLIAEMERRWRENLEIMQELYPDMSKDCVSKWMYLSSHGYWIVSKTPFGIYIKSSTPQSDLIGFMDWSGEITWKKEENEHLPREA